MTATALTTLGLPTGTDHPAVWSGRGVSRTVSAVDWSVPVSAQTTATICNLMQSQLSHTVTVVSGLLRAAQESASLDLVVLDNAFATFALENSGFCKLGFSQPTGSPTEFSVEVVGWRKRAGAMHSSPRKADPIPSSPAARALAQIRQASDLTIEALAPLIGVSRRTLHNWFAGGEISQRNEERLRALAEAVGEIAAVEPETARERLMERVPGSPRIYDLLAEGRYEAAVARGTGMEPPPRPLIYPKPRSLSTPLSARIAGLNDRSIPLDGSIDRRFTKRLKR
jgi:DNA-binding transcriptional regulator YiaG